MKTLAAIVVGLLVIGGTAQAQWRRAPPPGAPPGYGGGWYGMAGCGLGSLIFGPINSPGAQILASTTNSTFATQTFGITSGTSNCVSGGIVAMDRRQQAFAEVNFGDLKRDMAAGGGEFLTAFGNLLGCDGAAQPKLARVMQADYETLLPSVSTTPDQLVDAVHVRINADPELAGGCRDAGPSVTTAPPAATASRPASSRSVQTASLSPGRPTP